MSTENGTNQARTGRDVGSELIYLTKALKAPALRDAAARLAERARDEGWSHEEYLAVGVLSLRAGPVRLNVPSC
ncbi:hypothetical protein ABDE16_03590 [Streptomyces sp. BRB040]|uniref:hypothetical protein n=1 Tax=Streptomyces sp. BRB040 TaxID=3142634 RepID=UPI0031F66BAA